MLEKQLLHQVKYMGPSYTPSFSLTNKTRLTCLKRHLASIIKNSINCVEFNTNASQYYSSNMNGDQDIIKPWNLQAAG